MESILFERIFSKRATICFFLVCLLMLSCILRVAVIASSDYSAVQAQQSSYRIDGEYVRGTVYDCNMIPLTNNTSEILAAVSPTPRAIVAISTVLSGEELDAVLQTLSENKPAVCRVPYEIECEGITCTTVYKTSENLSLARHLIGYTDSTGHGVCGIERAYDELLYSGKRVSAVYSVDGKGGILEGIEPRFENDKLSVINGVVTTIDADIQNATEIACVGMQRGAAIVADTKSGKIRALVSLPQFDLNNLAVSLEDENSPLFNRALAAYSVGSVFKPCVAAAALESGYGNFQHICVGNTKIIDRVFNCHKRDGHGLVDLRHAIAFSCNCYFYNFAVNIGAQSVYNMASSLCFGNSITIADGLQTANGKLTPIGDITNEAILANLSIGQGELSLSPVSMLTLYCAIANKGVYYLPSVVEKTLKDGKTEDYDMGSPTRVMSEDTAEVLCDYLTTVISEGTGIEAATQSCISAGKTATAQTGRYDDNGKEITNSWFCGFFPAYEPEYVVIVMSDGETQKSTARIFAEIADGINNIKTS